LPAQIVKAPDVLATLTKGTVLSGTVVDSGKSAGLQVLTKYGTVELDVKLALLSGTKLALQVREGGQLHLQIVRTDTTAKLPDGTGKGLTPAPPSIASPDGATVRLPGQTLTATLQTTVANTTTARPGAASTSVVPPGAVSPAGMAGNPGNTAFAQLPAALRLLPAGSQFQVQITGVVATAASRIIPGTGSQAVPSGSVTATGTPPPSATSGATVSGVPKPGAAHVPLSTTASIASTTGPVVSGTVIASAANGRPVIQTAFGILSLNQPLQLPLGTAVNIQVLANSLPQLISDTAKAGGDPLAARLTGFTSGWPSLEALTLRGEEGRVSSALMSHVMQRVPAAGPGLSSSILFFLSALNSGQVGNWLGRPTLNQLQREGHGDLTARMDQDLIQIGRLSDSGGAEWRTLFLPFLDDGQIRQLRLFMRNRNDEDGEDSGDQPGSNATRFLLEIELSKLGDLQLDGLIRSKLFDLIVRTRRPFTRAIRNEIIRIFTDSNHDLGMAGQILFEASNQWRSTAAHVAGSDRLPDLMI
jgi:hypothetical protein